MERKTFPEVSKTAQEWSGLIKTTGSAGIFGMFPDGKEVTVGEKSIVGRGASYGLFPMFGTMSRDRDSLLELAHGSEQQVHKFGVPLGKDNYLLFGTEVLSYFPKKWHSVPGDQMAINYSCLMAKESYPADEVRPGVRLELYLFVPSRLGWELMKAVLKRPNLIEEVFQELCVGLTDTTKRYQTSTLKVIESGQIGIFNSNRLLGGSRNRDLDFTSPVGEVPYDPKAFVIRKVVS